MPRIEESAYERHQIREQASDHPTADGIQDCMGKQIGECTACVQKFELDDDGNIPVHSKPAVPRCCGSELPAFKKTYPDQPAPQRPKRQLPDSKEDFEISLRRQGWRGKRF
jgi:hypothetical protein